MEAGIRNRVEIWADGGYRHAHDIVKLHCMGANRVAFGTLAMVSLGCTICRGCQLDTCHVGIATQIETVEQAQEHGLKKFTPPGTDAAESCARFFQAMGEEVKAVVGSLGYDRAQDLVGRYDLLEQISHQEKIDLAPADHPARGVPGPRAARPPGRGGGAGRGPRRGRPGPRQADSDGAEAGLRRDRPGGRQGLRRILRERRVPTSHRRARPRARHRALGRDRPCPDLRRRPGGHRERRARASSSSTEAPSPGRASAPSTSGA